MTASEFARSKGPPPEGAPSEHAGAPALEVRRRRLLFRATHRGTYENDLMIGGFVRAHLDTLTEADVSALETIMEIPDTILADWLTGRAPIPADEETPMLGRMKEFLKR